VHLRVLELNGSLEAVVECQELEAVVECQELEAVVECQELAAALAVNSTVREISLLDSPVGVDGVKLKCVIEVVRRLVTLKLNVEESHIKLMQNAHKASLCFFSPCIRKGSRRNGGAVGPHVFSAPRI
jgi:hypothetical protein